LYISIYPFITFVALITSGRYFLQEMLQVQILCGSIIGIAAWKRIGFWWLYTQPCLRFT